ncbi:MAG: T9SS type A sorting domain-containing protein [Bacteroidetes bacterium]|nr:MAG: T9SS type A sorting domain-containing protein [Bacteroidota bacterium]
MKTNYASLFLVLLPGLSFGQISLDASMAPAVNSSIIYYDANVPSPPFTFAKSGIANTWDFSVLSPSTGQEDTVFFVDPASVSGGGSFPSATHATYEGGDESINMININSNDLTFLGFVGDPVGIGTSFPLSAQPPVAAMNFPYSYGSTINASTYYEVFTTGAAIGQPSIDSVRYKSTLYIDASVIAAGDIILPSGTFASLLERKINSNVDSAWMKGATTGNQWVMAPGFPSGGMDSAFYWYTDQSLEHMAHALYDDTGLHDVHYFKEQLTTDVNQIQANATSLIAYPNPVQDFLGFKGLNLKSIKEWSVTNADGRLLMKGTSGLEKLNVRNLSAGTYLFGIISEDGQLSSIRFVKN